MNKSDYQIRHRVRTNGLKRSQDKDKPSWLGFLTVISLSLSLSLSLKQAKILSFFYQLYYHKIRLFLLSRKRKIPLFFVYSIKCPPHKFEISVETNLLKWQCCLCSKRRKKLSSSLPMNERLRLRIESQTMQPDNFLSKIKFHRK